MTSVANLAEAKRLKARAAELEAKVRAMTVAEYEAAGLQNHTIPASYCCEAGLPLRAEAWALTDRAHALIRGEATASPTPTTKEIAVSPTARKDVTTIPALAAAWSATGFPLPASMIERAIAANQSAERFAIDASHYVASQQAEKARRDKEDELVAGIASYVPKPLHRTNPPHVPGGGSRGTMSTEDQLVADIVSFIPRDRLRPAE